MSSRLVTTSFTGVVTVTERFVSWPLKFRATSSSDCSVHKPNTSSGVDRSNKAAPPPAPEKGEALENMNASGGGNSGPASGDTGSGKGPKDP